MLAARISFKIQRIIDSLKLTNILELKRALYQFSEKESVPESEIELSKEIHKIIEQNFYYTLSELLELRLFEHFKILLDLSVPLDIFIDVTKIPNRFEHLSTIQLSGITSGQIGDIFKVLKIFNEYNLLNTDIPIEKLKVVEEIKKDKLILSNLQDLFGRVSDALIYHVFESMLKNILELFKTSISPEDGYDFFYNEAQLISFFNNYTIYGLSVANLGTIEQFIEIFQYDLSILNNKEKKNGKKFIEIEFRNRVHLVSINNIEKNLNKFISVKNHYKFYNLSMVLLGGLGPEGHGFTYSTPKGEIIEICSDRKETSAIIIKYKEFLKRQFLTKLNIELKNKNINENVVDRILKFLSEILKPKEMISYFKTKVILKQISEFLEEVQILPDFQGKEFQNVLTKISSAITIILRPIEMVDQFKCRMNLIEEGNIKSEDIAKLTSLKEKSHYDVLRERFFFQNQIKWLFTLYSKEILNFQKKRRKN
ncbi:MAG: hypothetical protein ACW96X_11265 [Promethearchaeota archaeon]|jgi:hypothetical protein